MLSNSKPVDITLEGRFYWELLYHIDNRGQNNPYKETRKITKTVTTSFSELKDSVQKKSINTDTSLDVGGVFDIISVSVKGSISTEVSSSYQTTINQKTESTVTEELTREFTVGADSIGEMYRLVYEGPGVRFATGTISTDGKRPLDKVFITCTAQQVPLIKGIKVKYTDQSITRPENIITETNGGDPDINRGFGGYYVWLIPEWTGKKVSIVLR